MSGERTTLKAMIAVGLGFWLFGIAMTETWIICVAPVLVAWSVFHLLTDAPLRYSRITPPTTEIDACSPRPGHRAAAVGVRGMLVGDPTPTRC